MYHLTSQMPIQNAVHFLQQIDIILKSYPCFEIQHSKINSLKITKKINNKCLSNIVVLLLKIDNGLYTILFTYLSKSLLYVHTYSLQKAFPSIIYINKNERIKEKGANENISSKGEKASTISSENSAVMGCVCCCNVCKCKKGTCIFKKGYHGFAFEILCS